MAGTPVLLYDAHEEHAGPLKSMATETPVFVKNRFQIFLSPSKTGLVDACTENGVKNVVSICLDL